MANIEQIKAVLVSVAQDTGDIAAEMQRLGERLDEAMLRLRATSAGSSHPKVDEAVRYLAQARDRLDEAGTLARGAVDAAGAYRLVI